MSARQEVRILKDADEMSRVAAQEFVSRAQEAVAARGRFAVALSGGSTPERLYRLLAQEDAPFRAELPWESMHFFWGDERHVPPDHSESNYRMAQGALLERAPVPPENIHRIEGEQAQAVVAAESYEQALRQFFALGPGELPRFDLILLGLGMCGHTASLFPHSPALREQQRLVTAVWVEKFNAYRITLTPPVINYAAQALFLVSGRDKAETLRTVLARRTDIDEYPAQLLRLAAGKVLWLAEKEAASLLQRRDL